MLLCVHSGPTLLAMAQSTGSIKHSGCKFWNGEGREPHFNILSHVHALFVREGEGLAMSSVWIRCKLFLMSLSFFILYMFTPWIKERRFQRS